MCARLGGTPAEHADDVVCVARPVGFGAVGSFYDDFRQTTDDEVLALLARHHR